MLRGFMHRKKANIGETCHFVDLHVGVGAAGDIMSYE
jgi:hypothetical protein